MFESYYGSSTQARKLEWKFGLGECVLRGHFAKKKTYEFNVNTMQALVMMAFNGTADVLTFDEVHAKVGRGLEENKLKMLLASLSCLEVKVLRKAPPPKGKNPIVKKSDKFQFNFKKFTHKKSRCVRCAALASLSRSLPRVRARSLSLFLFGAFL